MYAKTFEFPSVSEKDGHGFWGGYLADGTKFEISSVAVMQATGREEAMARNEQEARGTSYESELLRACIVAVDSRELRADERPWERWPDLNTPTRTMIAAAWRHLNIIPDAVIEGFTAAAGVWNPPQKKTSSAKNSST